MLTGSITQYLLIDFTINESGLLQYVLEPTRQSNILDLLLTNDSKLISGLQVECPLVLVIIM